MSVAMLVVRVEVRVKPELVEAFVAATLENARASLQEPGVARFDVAQDAADASHFVLLEVYRTADAPAEHKRTLHYARWRDTVESMMAVPRASTRYETVFPDDFGW